MASVSGAAAEEPDVADFSRPPVVAADAGLDVVSLSTGPGGVTAEQIGAILAPYAENAIPVRDSVLETWRANGLRIVRMPLADWPSVARELRLSPTAQRQWLPPNGAWTELLRGADEPRGQVVALDAERLELGPGTLRLLGRCWLSPAPRAPGENEPGAAAELTIELLPQLMEARRAPGRPALDVDHRLATAVERGMTFPRLGGQLMFRGDGDSPSVLLIIAERPDVDWSRPAAPIEPEADPATRSVPRVGEVVRNGAGSTAPAKQASAPGRPRPAAPSADLGAGPRVPLVRTLGEAMFRSPEPTVSADGAPRTVSATPPRAILALVPRVPRAFNIAPHARPTVEADQKTPAAAR